MLGETLPDPFGYPLRLRTSTKLGFKNPKWITAIEVSNVYTGRILGTTRVQLAEQPVSEAAIPE